MMGNRLGTRWSATNLPFLHAFTSDGVDKGEVRTLLAAEWLW